MASETNLPAETRPEWVAAETSEPPPGVTEAILAANLPPWIGGVLARRGVSSREEAEAFLSPGLSHLHDPFQLESMTEAVERLVAARDRSEPVVVVGDYDVDGVSATALLLAVFRACGIETSAVLPHRMRDGYGFQLAQVERAQEAGAKVIVTADCGSRSIDATAAALERGIDVIVTDHHIPGEAHDPRVFHINPKKPGSTYPFDELAGAGLAFKLASALAQACDREVKTEALLRVTCLGTIADLVPLRGENRAISSLGLRALGETRSPGLLALMKVAQVRKPVDAGDVGFRLGPRLNAAGRMDAPDTALQLLLERDPARAEELATQLDAWNRERRQAEAQAVAEARERIDALPTLPPVVLEWSPDWHRGVVGIAAGRIARRYHRPTVLLTQDGDLATGSGRSIRDVHLHDFLSGFEDRMERFGGHAQAIGLTVQTDRLEELRRDLREAATEWDPELLRRRYVFDTHLSAIEVDLELATALRQLEPFGSGNRQPLLRIGPLEPMAAPRFFGTDHLSLITKGPGGGRVGLVGWSWAERAAELNGRFEVLGFLEIDSYDGRPVVRLLDARPV